jgi:hypothetical protein
MSRALPKRPGLARPSTDLPLPIVAIALFMENLDPAAVATARDH